MIRKIYSAFAGISRFVQVLIGLVLLVILAFTVTNLLSTRSEMAGEAGTLAQPTATPSDTGPSDAEGDHTVPLITKGGDGTKDPTKDWLTYTDNVAGFTLKYPPDWKVRAEAPGKSISFMKDDFYYRGIDIDVVENKQDKNIQDVVAARIQELGSLISPVKATMVENITLGELSGLWLYAPYSGTLVESFFPHGDIIIHASLIEGGTIGARDPNEPVVQEDLKTFTTLLQSFKFTN